MDSFPWVALVRAWPQGDEESDLVIRMVRSFGDHAEDRSVATIGEALAQLREWLEELEGTSNVEPPS